MVPRKFLVVLVVTLPVLVTTFAVLMAGQLLVAGLGDTTGAAILRGCGIACLVLLVVDLILLIGVLGINQLESPRSRDAQPPDSEL